MGHCTGCSVPSDCGVISFCTGWTCTNSTCAPSYTAQGTALPPGSQTDGDCQEEQCNGTGDVQNAPDDGDLPPDDGNQCTESACSNGVAIHPALPANSPCNQGGGMVCDGASACVACNAPTHCPGGMVCESPTCTNHVCGLMDTPNNTPAPMSAQVDGDCKLVLCDGTGGTKVQADAADVPVDGNACTGDVCNGQTPSNPNLPQGTPCGNGLGCDGQGNCTLLGLGATCQLGTQCTSGFCRDGVCCDTSCMMKCRSCLAADTGGTDGTCALVTPGTDPGDDCQGNKTCTAQGMCSN
jgi:hypothetical protein